MRPCDCGFNEPHDNDDTCVARHCCAHQLPLIAPDGCEECFDLPELPEGVNADLMYTHMSAQDLFALEQQGDPRALAELEARSDD